MANFVALAAHELRTPVTIVHGFAKTLNHLEGRLDAEQEQELRARARTADGAHGGARRAAPRPFTPRGRGDRRGPPAGRPGELPRRDRVDRRRDARGRGRGRRSRATRRRWSTRACSSTSSRTSSSTPCATARAPVRVSATVSGARLLVLVEDAGPGVPGEIEETLFERFTRAGVARDRSTGTGLGLAIARAYARAHDGDLRYERRRPERRTVRRRSAVGRSLVWRRWRSISFARGAPAPECLPVAELADCARAAIERDGTTILSYGPSSGYGPLREWIAERHGVAPGRVFLTNGSLQGFVFLAQRLAPGKRVLVERPTYDRPLKILRELGAEVVGLACDDEGLDPDALEQALAGRRAAGLPVPDPDLPEPERPDAQRRAAPRASSSSPASTTCSSSRTTRTGSCASTASRCRRSIELSGGEIVYSSSFSKTIGPGLRVGWFVFPDGLAREIEAAATVDVHHARAARPGDRARVRQPRQLRAEPRARQGPARRAPRRDARGARPRAASAARRPGPTAATSSGSSSAGSTRPACSPGPRRRA